MRKIITLSIAGILVLSACAKPGDPNYNSGNSLNKQDVGTLLGAAAGAALGAQVGKGKGKYAAIAAGTLLGAGLGNQVGESLDRADLVYYRNTSQSALETNKTGQTATWKNPDSGHSGTVTPTRTYQTAQGKYCREYRQTINVGSDAVEGHGTACREPDGSWKIVN